MVAIYPRSAWGAAPPKSPLTPWNHAVIGGVQHWMGGYVSPESVDTPAEQAAHLRREQAGAFSGANGTKYIDVPYNFYVFPDGSIWEGRGWSHESGANGNADLNDKYLAVQYVAGPTPDHSLVTPLTTQAQASLLQLYTEATTHFRTFQTVVPHSLVRPGGTECPGAALRAFIPTINAYMNGGVHPPSQLTPLPAPQPVPADVGAVLRALAAAAEHIRQHPLKKGDRGQYVLFLQKIINAKAGGKPLAEDGVFGAKTQAAVKFIQGANHIKVDGIAGRDTLRVLGL